MYLGTILPCTQYYTLFICSVLRTDILCHTYAITETTLFYVGIFIYVHNDLGIFHNYCIRPFRLLVLGLSFA